MFDKREESLKDLLNQVVNKNKRLQRGIGERKLEQVWAEEMGPMINGYTTRIQYSGGTMTVYLTSSTLRNELLNGKDAVITRLNEVCGEGFVKKIFFR